MGFLDRLFGGRAKTAEETRFPGEKMVVKAPMDGIVLPLEQLPDETFAAAILGPGCGIEPTGGTVYAPFDGKVTSIVSTLHAVGLESTEGIELLIHIGIDTIALRGSGFTPLVREGQAVKAGTPLLNVDLDAIRAANHHRRHRDQRRRPAKAPYHRGRHRLHRHAAVQIRVRYKKDICRRQMSFLLCSCFFGLIL